MLISWDMWRRNAIKMKNEELEEIEEYTDAILDVFTDKNDGRLKISITFCNGDEKEIMRLFFDKEEFMRILNRILKKNENKSK